jgi:hypothetical protein
MKKKDSAAQAMARKRWAGTTPEERAEAGRKMAQARWAPGKTARKRSPLLRAGKKILRVDPAEK